MVWSNQGKTITTTEIVGRPKRHPQVIGRTPTGSAVQFGPYALYLAAARASHLHHFSPSIATPEFQMLMRLIEPHVDDTSPDFAVLSSANRFKDFVGTYFTGTVAAGIAYLAMVGEGYVWAAHYEALTGGSPDSKTTPDFAFLGPHPGIALMEAKGSASSKSKFKQAVRNGYLNQVEPHLGHFVGGIRATHGYCIGSWLRRGSPATMNIHYTEPATQNAQTGGGGDVDAAMASAIQRQNYATVFALAHSGALGEAIGSGRTERETTPTFVRVHWRGRRWVTSLGLIEGPWFYAQELYFIERKGIGWVADWPFAARLVFAVEEKIAKAALQNFLRPRDASDAIVSPRGLEFELGGDGRAPVQEDRDGAVLPDGLALIDIGAAKAKFELVVWNPKSGGFDLVGRSLI